MMRREAHDQDQTDRAASKGRREEAHRKMFWVLEWVTTRKGIKVAKAQMPMRMTSAIPRDTNSWVSTLSEGWEGEAKDLNSLWVIEYKRNIYTISLSLWYKYIGRDKSLYVYIYIHTYIHIMHIQVTHMLNCKPHWNSILKFQCFIGKQIGSAEM